MRIKIKASVGIKTRDGTTDFGTVLWIDGDKLMLSSSSHLVPGSACELKIELNGAGGWIYTQAHVLRSTDYQSNRNTRSICHLTELTERDRERLQTFVDLQQNDQQLAVRVPLGISAAGRTSPPSGSTAIPLRDPLHSLSEDNRRLTVRWYNGRTYRRDWDLHLANGRLPVSCTAPIRSVFMLRLILPDGFVVTFPAEVSDRNQAGWCARFLIPIALRADLQASAQGTARQFAR